MVHKEPEQFERLMRAIWEPNNDYAIHVDRTAPHHILNAAAEIARNRNNVWIVPSINCHHGGYSLVRAQQRGIQTLLNASKRWSFFINLSGEDFPLKNQDDISRLLADTPNRNFLKVFDPWDAMHWKDPDKRYDGIYWEPPNKKRAHRVGRIMVRRRWLLGDAKIFGGSQWMILSRSFCEHVATRSNVWRARLFFRNTYVPDESFYQTLLMNSPFRHTLVNDNRRFIDWTSGPERPRILRTSDLSRLTNCDALFARKVNARIDNTLVERLEDLTRA
jgi:hypothetical protein